MTTPVDLRSDTVTRPTPAMRAAMAAAPVGDDQYGEDPLDQRAAGAHGRAARQGAGTLAAVRNDGQPGRAARADAARRRGRRQPRSATPAGTRPAARRRTPACSWSRSARAASSTSPTLEAAIKPRGLPVYPPTTLVEIENTHNRSGGIVFPQDEVVRVCALARSRGIATFLDGARLWNASVASGMPRPSSRRRSTWSPSRSRRGSARRAARCSPAPRELIAAATRQRRMLGGAMRQTGFFAAAALHGIEHHRARLADDHANARRFAEALAGHRAIELDLATVQTNIVVFRLRAGAIDAATLVQRARDRGRARQRLRCADDPRGHPPRRLARAGRACRRDPARASRLTESAGKPSPVGRATPSAARLRHRRAHVLRPHAHAEQARDQALQRRHAR